MKTILSSSLLSACILSCSSGPIGTIDKPQTTIKVNAPVPPDAIKRKVQVAILLDTSNSMDGLIDQAKARLWSIVNEVNELKYEGQTPQIEIALYEYGNTNLEPNDHWIRRILQFTADLDEVSNQLFQLTTNGGDEYCGAVIKKSIHELEWSNDPLDLKMIYIAGNEPFDQGPIDFRSICSDASEKNIFINTIYCGAYNEGIREKWQSGASCSKGDFFNINTDKEIVYIPTEYDAQIQNYNDSLNLTYFGYGTNGAEKKEMQRAQDENATSMGAANLSDRIASKASANYSTYSWDVVSAGTRDTTFIENISEEELPQEMKEMSIADRKTFIVEMNDSRVKYQNKITELNNLRQKVIDEEMKKDPEKYEDGFGQAVRTSIRSKAKAAGFDIE